MLAKKHTVVIASASVWLVLIVLSGWPRIWIWRLDYSTLGFLALLCASLWSCVLLWALHHLAFQLGGLFPSNAPQNGPPREERPAVAILYATCDDFNAECCKSCLDQDYDNFRLLVLDDSKSPAYRKVVQDFCSDHSPRCEHVARPNEKGFKAGNLNYALGNVVQEEWVLLVDADQILPRDYLSTLALWLPYDESVAFVQTANQGRAQASSPFQRALGLAISLYFFRDLRIRERFGFLPLLGHSAMIRKAAWERVGKFPLVVSEDYAFAMRLATNRQSGIFVRDPIGVESAPYDFGAYVLRLRKYAGGTAELFRREMASFLRGRAHLAEKWDALMQLGWYLLMPLVTLNGFLSAYVLHGMWQQGLRYPEFVLPCLYSVMLFLLLCLCLSVSEGIVGAVRFYFWSSAINAASMPLAALSFVQQLVCCRPSFNRTPKNDEEQRLQAGDSLLMLPLGVLAVLCATVWWSVFSPVLLGQGIAYLSYPLYGKLCSRSFAGLLGRALIYIPGLLMLTGLYTMWRTV
jgi:cellulose synthase/poly-beta-1,6-N-acetylglucosamine synthase-like glycosyltransferase